MKNALSTKCVFPQNFHTRKFGEIIILFGSVNEIRRFLLQANLVTAS